MELKKNWCEDWKGLPERDQLSIWAMFGKERLREQFKNDFENLASPVELLKNARFNFRLYGFNKPCSRCTGTGMYAYNPRFGRTCFKCAGTSWEVKVPSKSELNKFINQFPEGIRYNEKLKAGEIKGDGQFLAKFKTS